MARTRVAPIAAQPEATGEYFNIEVGGCCDAFDQSMSIQLLSDDCQETGTCTQLFIGSNDLGQTAPAYISAADCGIVDPTDLALIGFPDAHIIQVINVNDTADGTTTTTTGVPASTGVGTMLLLLALLGGSTLLARRRALS